MAEATGSIFNKKATEKLRSPDDLDKYVRVTNPSVWVMLAACIALIAGLLAWGVFGSVSTNVSATGTVIDGVGICFLNVDDVAKVHEGDSAVVAGEPATVATVARIPVSPGEAGSILGSEYLVKSLMKDDWAYAVTFNNESSGNIVEDVPVTVQITVERVAPISLILRNRG